ncbi:MAG TPA: ABC transporter ATP-binding protein [Elusimicrobiota bacterium]|nr:ABC transporter ATP-binding protein [Elusimicrobiota bacterium]
MTKKFGDFTAVKDATFSVQPGEVVGLLGPNGAGKTTTLRMLTGYIPVSSGSAVLAGYSVQDHSLEVRRRVGYLSELNPLYDQLGVWECLQFVAELRGIDPVTARRKIRDVVGMCALQDVVSRDVSTLSKGYRQRLGLAVAIVHDPDILILDEPTSALDPLQQKDIRDLVMMLKAHKTILLSTHILPEAQALCDRLLIIHRGRIVAQGTVDELRTQISGARSYYVRFKGERSGLERELGALPVLTSSRWEDEVESGCAGFVVQSENDPREALFELAVTRRWPLMELRPLSASLDDIFREITSSSPSSEGISTGTPG